MVAPVERDTTFYLWDVQWRCRVPQLQTTDEDYIRHFGTPTTFNAAFDRELSQQWIDTMLSIAKMVEYHQRGIPVKVVKFEDMKAIYDHIENHLRAWINNVQNNLNIGDVPIDDLIAMNEFANTIYPIARSLHTEDTSINSSFMRAIDKLGFTGFNERFFKKDEVKAPERKREDLGDVFKNVRSGFNRWN